jgi:homoserine kinase
LGPGFDCLALALDIRCRIEAEPTDGWLLEEDGVTSTPDLDDRVVRAAAAVATGPFRLRIDNDIPRSRGLGSSSAVTAAAAAAAMRATEIDVEPRRVFEVVADLEGHEDNAAAAVYGGLVLAGLGSTRHLELCPDLRVVVGIPGYTLATAEARAALPTTIGRAVLARGLARLGFLIEGLRTGDRAAFAAASGDELHEQPRSSLSPLTGDLIAAALGAGALHACWSGAGPTALAFVTDDSREPVTAAMKELMADRGTVRSLAVAAEGLR